MDVLLPARFLPVSRNWFVEESERVYFGQNLFIPFLCLVIVHWIWPILGGMGRMYISLSSSTGVKGFRSLATKASNSSLQSSVRGACGTIFG